MMAVLAAGSYLTTGCSPNATEHQLADGFIIKSSTPLFENSGGSRKLYHQSPSGTQKVVWKYVPGTVLVRGGTAVFIGDWNDPDKIEGYGCFAVKDSGIVIHITKAVLTRAAQKNGAQPDEYFKRYGDYELDAQDNIVKFKFSPNFGVNKRVGSYD